MGLRFLLLNTQVPVDSVNAHRRQFPCFPLAVAVDVLPVLMSQLLRDLPFGRQSVLGPDLLVSGSRQFHFDVSLSLLPPIVLRRLLGMFFVCHSPLPADFAGEHLLLSVQQIQSMVTFADQLTTSITGETKFNTRHFAFPVQLSAVVVGVNSINLTGQNRRDTVAPSSEYCTVFIAENIPSVQATITDTCPHAVPRNGSDICRKQ